MTPPGWYGDPWSPVMIRYWDGAVWTSYTAPGPALPATAVERPRVPLVAAIWAIVVTAGSLIAERLILQSLETVDLPIVGYIALAVVIAYGPVVAYCVWASHRWGTGRMSTDFGFRFRPSDAGWGPVIWLAAYAAVIPVGIIIQALKVPMRSNTEALRNFDADRGVLIATLIAAVIAAPFVEELVFRGVVMNGFRSVMHPAWAVALQAVIFGAAHFDPSRGTGNIGLIIVLSTVGAVLGGGAYLLRRIGPTIIAHGLYNTVALLIVIFVLD